MFSSLESILYYLQKFAYGLTVVNIFHKVIRIKKYTHAKKEMEILGFD